MLSPVNSLAGLSIPLLTLAVIVFGTAPVAAQQVGQNAPLSANQTATFKASSQLVVETVSVTDKKGNPIEGLTAKDFSVTENGVPQSIAVFQYEQLPATPVPQGRLAPAHVQTYDKLARTQIMPEAPGTNHYKDRRLLALYLDMTSMPPG